MCYFNLGRMERNSSQFMAQGKVIIKIVCYGILKLLLNLWLMYFSHEYFFLSNRSFGHQLAKLYNVKEGWNDLSPTKKDKVMLGFSQTRLSVCKV